LQCKEVYCTDWFGLAIQRTKATSHYVIATQTDMPINLSWQFNWPWMAIQQQFLVFRLSVVKSRAVLWHNHSQVGIFKKEKWIT